jgi:hypothetical protein
VLDDLFLFSHHAFVVIGARTARINLPVARTIRRMARARQVFALLISSLLFSVCFAQKVVKVKRSSADFKAIIQAVTPYANAHAAHPVRVNGDVVRRSGDWIFLLSQMSFVDPKFKGDGALMALLKKGKRWTIREIMLGSGGMEDMAAEWEKRHKLPKGLVAK